MRTLAFLCMLLITPPSAQAALTLADLDGVTGAQFTAGPLVFRDFDANLLPFAFPGGGGARHPGRLEDIPVVPLDHGDGGFTLATPFIAIGPHNAPSFVDFSLRFTVETAGSASIVGFTVSVDDMVANGLGGATLGLNGSTVFSVDFFNNNVGSPSRHFQISPTNALDMGLRANVSGGVTCSPEVEIDCGGQASFSNPTLTFQVAQVPEPSAFWLFGLILCALPLLRRRIARGF